VCSRVALCVGGRGRCQPKQRATAKTDSRPRTLNGQNESPHGLGQGPWLAGRRSHPHVIAFCQSLVVPDKLLNRQSARARYASRPSIRWTLTPLAKPFAGPCPAPGWCPCGTQPQPKRFTSTARTPRCSHQSRTVACLFQSPAGERQSTGRSGRPPAPEYRSAAVWGAASSQNTSSGKATGSSDARGPKPAPSGQGPVHQPLRSRHSRAVLNHDLQAADFNLPLPTTGDNASSSAFELYTPGSKSHNLQSTPPRCLASPTLHARRAPGVSWQCKRSESAAVSRWVR